MGRREIIFGIAIAAVCLVLGLMSPVRINISFNSDATDVPAESERVRASEIASNDAATPTGACSEDTFIIVSSMPTLVGGLDRLQQTLSYPVSAREAGVEGRVFVQFVVDRNGNVVDEVVIRGVSDELDAEALRAVRASSFTPGQQDGEAVCVKMSLPITFKL